MSDRLLGLGSASSSTGSASLGTYATASGYSSVAIGRYVTAGPANYNMVLGAGIDDPNHLINNIDSSLMVGFNSTIPTLFVGPSAGAGTTGNVGIGTTAPGSKLEVNGQIKITGGSPGENKVLTSDANGLATWQAAGSGGVVFNDDGHHSDLPTSATLIHTAPVTGGALKNFVVRITGSASGTTATAYAEIRLFDGASEVSLGERTLCGNTTIGLYRLTIHKDDNINSGATFAIHENINGASLSTDVQRVVFSFANLQEIRIYYRQSSAGSNVSWRREVVLEEQ